MNIDSLRLYCLGKKGVTEGFPFDEVTLVFKVMEKIFCLTSLDSTPLSINLKCDPELALDLRDKYEAVQPGYHMSKKHWNTVVVDSTVPASEIRSWIDHSYDLVVKGLRKAEREKLLSLPE